MTPNSSNCRIRLRSGRFPQARRLCWRRTELHPAQRCSKQPKRSLACIHFCGIGCSEDSSSGCEFVVSTGNSHALRQRQVLYESGVRSGVERLRLGGATPIKGAAQQAEVREDGDPDRHWVTIDGNHVLIEQTNKGKAQHKQIKTGGLSARDKSYLDKYYDAVDVLAKRYGVEPSLVLGVGIESGFASAGTYLRSGDAFGMTGGNTRHMTTAKSPTENVEQFFKNYRGQIRGTGNDASAFINGLQGRTPSGERVKGWKVYNSVNSNWAKTTRDGISQMRRAVPLYLSDSKAKAGR